MESCLLIFNECILPGLKKLGGFFLGCLWEKVEYMYKFKENLDLLEKNLDQLRAIRDDVVLRVDDGVLKGGQALPTVDRWLLEVKTIETNIKQLIDDASTQDASSQVASTHGASSQNASTSGCWPINCNLGEDVSKKLKKVESLSNKIFVVVTEKYPPPVVIERNCLQTFGLQTTLGKTWETLMKDQNRRLGIYGMGGVGKTTLLTLINNKFVEAEKKFDVVIWVTVVKDADIEKIQDTIGERLHLCDENWSNYTRTTKRNRITSVLTNKPRFVLLLDDVWEEVGLSKIGIPMLGGEYKIVYSTRSKEVCHQMREKGKIIKVECLADNDAWDLFKEKCMPSGEFLDIAKEIAATCCGLPLALEIIGKTMASKTTDDQWHRALETLKSYPSELKGTEKGIFEVLKLSYDNLEKIDAKCFMYCALFPKAYTIKKDKLVEYWIGEGFIDENDGRQRAKDRGYDTIDTLVDAGLLVDVESEQKVYMHDMIRGMALSVVSTPEHEENYVVKAGAGLIDLPNGTVWKTVTKMSLMNNQIESIPDDHEFPNPDRLVTLFLQNNKLVDIVGRFFLVLSTLVVLDLSGNQGIIKLPEVSKLVSLRYLSLLGTNIKELPHGLEQLNKLIHLDLESTANLESIDLISGLLNLQVLRFYGSKTSLDVSLLEHLKHLKGLHLLTITVRKFDVLEAFLGSNLAGRTQGLYLEGLKVSVASTLGVLGSLRKVKMIKCDIIESDTDWEGKTRPQYSPSTSCNPITPWFKNLSDVELISCEDLRDLTWLIYAANLESLSITLSSKMEEVISKKKAGDVKVEPFLKLQVLDLDLLNELKSIYWSPLLFPKLQKVHITKCPKLEFRSICERKIDDLLIRRS